MMETATAGGEAPALTWRERSRDYRDGLMIALLALRPLRRANFAHPPRAGPQSDQSRRCCWWLEIAGARTCEPPELPFPVELEPALKSYLAT